MSFVAKHGTDILGAGLLAAVSFGLFSEYQKSQAAASSSSSNKGLPPASSAITSAPDSKYSAKAYLKELSSAGDETAQKALAVPQQRDFPTSPSTPASASSYQPEQFRFDLTPMALERSLRNILDGKKKHEQSVLQQFKREGYPKDYEETLRGMRADREEVDQLVRALEKTRSRSGSSKSSWWPKLW